MAEQNLIESECVTQIHPEVRVSPVCGRRRAWSNVNPDGEIALLRQRPQRFEFRIIRSDARVLRSYLPEDCNFLSSNERFHRIWSRLRHPVRGQTCDDAERIGLLQTPDKIHRTAHDRADNAESIERPQGCG